MINYDGNKSDDRMLNDLRSYSSNDSFELNGDYSMFDPCTIHEVTIPSYSDSLFQTGVHLSRIDSETGYNDYDPRDQPELEKETLRKKMKRYNVVPHGSGASHIPSEFTDLSINAFLAHQRMLKQGANLVHIYDNVTGKFWDIEGESESESDIEQALRQVGDMKE